jgi:hypothetical protein
MSYFIHHTFLFALISSCIQAQDWDSIIKGDKKWLIQRDNEFERNEAGKEEPFYVNPLMINGKPLDYNHFNLRSSGIMTVVRRNSSSEENRPIPFAISLRRNGQRINPVSESIFQKVLLFVEISEVFKHAKMNDELIIRL